MELSREEEIMIHESCLGDIARIDELFLGGRFSDPQLARARYEELKARWRSIADEVKGAEAAKVILQALNTTNQARTNTKPSGKWFDVLAEAKVEFRDRVNYLRKFQDS